MAKTSFLQKLKTPANLPIPTDWDSLLAGIAKYMAVVSEFSNGGAIETVASETKPADTSVLWVALDSSGQAKGTFYYYNGLWLSTAFTKGEDIQPFVGSISSIHPHWRICDPAIAGATVNSVTIPDMTNRMMVMATTGGDYAIGDTGGSDTVTLSESNLPSHNHSKGTLSAETVSGGGLHDHTGGLKSALTTAGADDSLRLTPGNLGSSESQGLGSDAGSDHDHNIDVSGETGNTGGGTSFDVRSRYYGVGYKIYVGIE